MTTTLTKEQLDQALANIATKGDIALLQRGVKETKADVAETKTLVNSLVASVDTYLKRTETWHDELTVLQARFQQVVHLLDQKGIIKEHDTHIG
jgi:hypothetical protein